MKIAIFAIDFATFKIQNFANFFDHRVNHWQCDYSMSSWDAMKLHSTKPNWPFRVVRRLLTILISNTRHPYIVLRLQHFCPTTFLKNFVSTCIRLFRNGVNQIKSVILYMFLAKNSQIWPILPQKSCSICLFWAEMFLKIQEIWYRSIFWGLGFFWDE